MEYFAHGPSTTATLHRLAAETPRTLACMHGSAWRGDGSAPLPLTDIAFRNAMWPLGKARERYADGMGMYLDTASGSKYWRLKYRLGRRKSASRSASILRSRWQRRAWLVPKPASCFATVTILWRFARWPAERSKRRRNGAQLHFGRLERRRPPGVRGARRLGASRRTGHLACEKVSCGAGGA